MPNTITSANSTTYGNLGGAANTNRKTELDSAAFLQLLVTQLAHQDPTAPMSNAELYQSTAVLGQSQSLSDLTKSMSSMQGASLIGKTITGTDTGSAGSLGSPVTGKVVGLTNISGKFNLSVQDSSGGKHTVSLSNVFDVQS